MRARRGRRKGIQENIRTGLNARIHEGRLRVSGRMRKRRWAEGKARDERTMKAG